MRTDFYFESKGIGRIYACKWMPEGKPVAVLQIIHGIAEHIERYNAFAEYLNGMGYAVVAEDHMGHGKSINGGGVRGFFHGGWFTAVADSYTLLTKMQEEYPDVPYVLLGHSMGSFMARTVLCRYPESGISAAIISGTGWQPRQMLSPVVKFCEMICKRVGEQNPSEKLQNMVFGGYNKKIEHPRTSFDWLTRDARCVDAYIEDPLCGFTASCGLLRDMLCGIRFIEDPKNLANMNKELPVLFVAGGDDPVGSYGKGVHQAAEAFQTSGMKNVSVKVYPMGRHEILNEINKEEVYTDVANWLKQVI